MRGITQLTIENIRCFAETQTLTLPRIVVLVGENNVGKSTFLACCATIAQLACNEDMNYNPFNSEVFDMGRFETIARNEADSFSLGGVVDGVGFDYRFIQTNSATDIWEKSVIINPESCSSVKIERDKTEGNWKVSNSSFSYSVDHNFISYNQISLWLGRAIRYQNLPYGGYEGFKNRIDVSEKDKKEFAKLSNYLKELSSSLPKDKLSILSVPPNIEDRKRFYRVLPKFLSNSELFSDSQNSLKHSGKQIGLFSDIRITPNIDGTTSTEVSIDGRWFNLVDVGFGVHGALPLLHSICERDSTTVLMQQPEKHLHPKVEVELTRLIAKSNNRFLIETHSDFIIESLCIFIRKKLVKFEDVVVLWFEATTNGTRIHPIEFDKSGNILNAPEKYRDFFVDHINNVLDFV